MAAPLGKRKSPCARRGGGAAYEGAGSAMEARDLRWETLEALRASSKGRLKYFRHSDRDEVRLLGVGRQEPLSAVRLGAAARSRGLPRRYLRDAFLIRQNAFLLRISWKDAFLLWCCPPMPAGSWIGWPVRRPRWRHAPVVRPEESLLTQLRPLRRTQRPPARSPRRPHGVRPR